MRSTRFVLALAALFGASYLATTASANGGGDGWLPIADDKRQTIRVAPLDRHHLLYEMRSMLHGLFNIQNALARHDMEAVALEAGEIGGLIDKIPRTLKGRMPEPFVMLGNGLKQSFTHIQSAAKTKDERAIQAGLAEALSYCAGCHDTYRFQDQ